MFSENFIKKYLLRGLIAAAIYSVTVVIFLVSEKFQSIWILYLGNAFYMLTIAVIIYLSNRSSKFSESPVNSAISGHVLSFTGAALSVVLAVLLYLLFSTGIFTSGKAGETLTHAPAVMSNTNSQGMLFVLIVNAALGNTITGFFAAIFTSFGSSKKKLSEERS